MLFHTFVVAAIMAITSANKAHISDWAELPPCAPSCTTLYYIFSFCNGFFNKTVAKQCLCFSPELSTLHDSGAICLHACGLEASDRISDYYNKLCIQSPVVSESTTTAPPPSSTSVLDLPTGTLSPPSPSPANNKAEGHKTWMSGHAKYLIIAGVMIGAALAALLIAAFILHHRHRKAELKKTFQQNGLIPLQPLSPRQTPLPPSPINCEENLPATVPSSPLETSFSSYSFGETLRAYDEENLEREQAFARRDELRNEIARAMAGDNRAT